MATDKRLRKRENRQQKLEAQRKSDARKRVVRRTSWTVGVAVVVIVSIVWIVAGNSTPLAPLTAQQKADKIAVAAGCPASTSTPANTLAWPSAPAMTIDTSLTYLAHFHTTAGDFVVALNPKEAPQTVNNFVFLAEHKFYDCVIFHRVWPGFMVQGGDPKGTGMNGPGYTIPDEFPAPSNPQYPLGSIAMANTGAPHSGGSQFFIVTGPNGESLPAKYSLFGKVVSGFATVRTIERNGDQNANTDQQGTTLQVTERMLTVTITTAKKAS